MTWEIFASEQMEKLLEIRPFQVRKTTLVSTLLAVMVPLTGCNDTIDRL